MGFWVGGLEIRFDRFLIRLRSVESGFTIVELLVVIAISALLVGGGLAAYTNFNETESIRGAGKRLYNDLRLAQGKAAANEKPVECGDRVLEGYQLRFTGSDSYVVEAWCGGEGVEVGGGRTLAAGITRSGAGSVEVKFYILGKGAETKSFYLQGFNRFYQVNVSTSGEVVDMGLVSSLPLP